MENTPITLSSPKTPLLDDEEQKNTPPQETSTSLPEFLQNPYEHKLLSFSSYVQAFAIITGYLVTFTGNNPRSVAILIKLLQGETFQEANDHAPKTITEMTTIEGILGMLTALGATAVYAIYALVLIEAHQKKFTLKPAESQTLTSIKRMIKRVLFNAAAATASILNGNNNTNSLEFFGFTLPKTINAKLIPSILAFLSGAYPTSTARKFALLTFVMNDFLQLKYNLQLTHLYLKQEPIQSKDNKEYLFLLLEEFANYLRFANTQQLEELTKLQLTEKSLTDYFKAIKNYHPSQINTQIYHYFGRIVSAAFSIFMNWNYYGITKSTLQKACDVLFGNHSTAFNDFMGYCALVFNALAIYPLFPPQIILKMINLFQKKENWSDYFPSRTALKAGFMSAPLGLSVAMITIVLTAANPHLDEGIKATNLICFFLGVATTASYGVHNKLKNYFNIFDPRENLLNTNRLVSYFIDCQTDETLESVARQIKRTLPSSGSHIEMRNSTPTTEIQDEHSSPHRSSICHQFFTSQFWFDCWRTFSTKVVELCRPHTDYHELPESESSSSRCPRFFR
ncbi:MAG: hypothetical protein KIT27_05240 [Legionellales bacterium]|nr:hypothetical protein [Legionellales bacterium]